MAAKIFQQLGGSSEHRLPKRGKERGVVMTRQRREGLVPADAFQIEDEDISSSPFAPSIPAHLADAELVQVG